MDGTATVHILKEVPEGRLAEKFHLIPPSETGILLTS